MDLILFKRFVRLKCFLEFLIFIFGKVKSFVFSDVFMILGCLYLLLSLFWIFFIFFIGLCELVVWMYVVYFEDLGFKYCYKRFNFLRGDILSYLRIFWNVVF